MDLRHADGLSKLLETLRPRFIFHVAAVHGEAGSRYEPIWQDMLAVNVGATHVCLEYLRSAPTAASSMRGRARHSVRSIRAS
jgi:nucleoside-diphosphate-sugar epimerase